MKKVVLSVAALLLLLGACAPASHVPPGVDVSALSFRGTLIEQPIEPLDDSFVNGSNSFGLSAAKLLYNQNENIAFSPASIELALCMTREGAGGQTADEMKKALGLETLTDEQITAACRLLMWRANTGGMEAANAIWLSSDYTFAERFVDTCTKDYMADAYPLVIPGAMDAINAWADEKTHGRINDIITEEFNDETKIVLANALYYLGDWEMPFEANNTYEREFSAPSGKVKTDFMHSDRQVPYYQNDDFFMISLNFKSGEDQGRYAMAFLLPVEGSSIGDMLTVLDADIFATALDGAAKQEVWIRLPKFEFSFFTKLKETLISMGMLSAFDEIDADFSPMTQEKNALFISEVLHKCYIRVDELGAEAAAVTAVAAADGAAMIEEEPPKFYADRPFLFAIYSLEDGAIAFMGTVNDPTQG